MRRWLHDHGLSLLLIVMVVSLQLVWHTLEPREDAERWADWAMSVSTDLFGVLVLVVATKRLTEKGSAEG